MDGYQGRCPAGAVLEGEESIVTRDQAEANGIAHLELLADLCFNVPHSEHSWTIDPSTFWARVACPCYGHHDLGLVGADDHPCSSHGSSMPMIPAPDIDIILVLKARLPPVSARWRSQLRPLTLACPRGQTLSSVL